MKEDFTDNKEGEALQVDFLRLENARIMENRDRSKPKVLVPVLLFLTTIITTTIAGALFEGAELLVNPADIVLGVPFAAALLFILGTHEFAHYIAARAHGVSTTLPLFIPAPPLPPLIGTFGAVIKMKSPIMTKRALVDIGASGPIAGFFASILMVYWGLEHSYLMPPGIVPEPGSFQLGSSIIFDTMLYMSFGVTETYEVYLHSVALAGWLGFFITALNLLPLGQLDGGHIVYAAMGDRFGPSGARRTTLLFGVLLIILGVFTWPGWIVWVVLIYIIGARHPFVPGGHIPLDASRRFICVVSLIVFVLTFMPSPVYII
jgi:membrane-associated protease RseP (regulator of RpoE activity)